MQILHWSLTCPQLSTGDFGGSASLPLRKKLIFSTVKSASLIREIEPPELSTNKIHTTFNKQRQLDLSYGTFTVENYIEETCFFGEDMDDKLPTYYIHNNTTTTQRGEHGMEMEYQDTSDTQTTEHGDPIVTAQGSERNNPSGGDKPPGDHYDDDDGNSKKQNLEDNDDENNEEGEEDNNNEDDDEEEEDEELIPYLSNNQDSEILRRKNKAVLIVNLYPPERGYTICCYVRELEGNDPNEIQVFKESHLIPYSETYLLDCIDMEVVPLKLVEKLERIDGINLMRYFSCVVCEIRDYRRFSSNLSKRNSPVVKKLLLRPTNHTLFSQLDRLIETSVEDAKLCKRLMLEDEDTRSRANDSYPSNNCEEHDEADESSPPKRPKMDNSDEVMHLDTEHLSFQERLELEKQLVLRTYTGLCLDPSKSVGLIANVRQFERFKWNAPEIKNAVQMTRRKMQSCSQSQRSNFLARLAKLKSDTQEDEKPPFTFFQRDNNLNSFLQFVKKKKNLEKSIAEPLKLPEMNCIDYPPLAGPSSMDDITRLGQPAEHAVLRPVMSENYIRKVEEYTLETERRKRPHTTKLSIYQRNGAENYFGELEQESFAEPNNNNIISSTIQRGSFYSSSNGFGGFAPSTKCEFELGSAKNVQLYVRQFTDIFTEDGRRPCRIIYSKLGHPHPQVITVNDYISMNRTPTSSIASTINPSVANNPSAIVNSKIVNNNPAKTSTSLPSSSTPSCTSVVSSSPSPVVSVGLTVAAVSSSPGSVPQPPPVQIVHPQPRSLQQAQISQAQILYTMASHTPTILQQPQPVVQGTGGANLNLSVNLNPGRILQQQPLLTRPQIYNLNLRQQLSSSTSPANINYTGPKMQTASQQHLQQQQQIRASQSINSATSNNNNLRLKQPNLANLLSSNSGPKPLTVAIQPQPQSQQLNQTIQIHNTGTDQNSQKQQQNLQLGHIVQQTQQPHQQQTSQAPIMIMVSPPSNSNLTGSIPSGVHQNINGNVSLNLNTISLDSLLNASNSQQQNYVTTTSFVSANNSNTATLNRLNILRLSNNSNTVTLTPQQQQLIRQNALSLNMNHSNNTTATLMNTGFIINSTPNSIHHQQGRMVNNNNVASNRNAISVPVGNQTNSKNSNGNLKAEIHEMNVPDLQSLLQATPTVSSSMSYRNPNQSSTTTATIDGLNLDLNVNLNLNLGGGSASASLGAPPVNSNHTMDGNRHIIYDTGNNNSGEIHQDSLFNALSEVIGPELGQTLEGTLRQNDGNQSGMNVVSSSLSPTKSATNNNNNSVITLNDLLGSPPIIVSSTHLQGNGISPLQSPQSPSITSILSPISPNLGAQPNIAYSTTPRLSALLAGTPSADSSSNMLSSPNVFDSSGRGANVATTINSSSYGNLLDRLVASSSQPQVSQRTGGSRLNPIATATPMLAATLAQGTPLNNARQTSGNSGGGSGRPTAYRQIAPAPAPNPQPQQPQQLINLLGFVGNASSATTTNPTQPTVRVNANTSTQGTSGNLGSR